MDRARKVLGDNRIKEITSCIEEWIGALSPEEYEAAKARTKKPREHAKTTQNKLVERHVGPFLRLVLRARHVSSMDTFEVLRYEMESFDAMGDWDILYPCLVTRVMDKMFGCTAVYHKNDKGEESFQFSFKDGSDFQEFFKLDKTADVALRARCAEESKGKFEFIVRSTMAEIKAAEDRLEELRKRLEREEHYFSLSKAAFDKVANRLERRKALDVPGERSPKKPRMSNEL